MRARRTVITDLIGSQEACSSVLARGTVGAGLGDGAAGVGAAVGVGAAAGMEGVGDILIGAGAILILTLILTGVTGAVITEAATAVTGAATAVTENSRIGRFPKNLCSTTGLERGVQNA